MEGATFDMEEYRDELDRTAAAVLPETYPQHARIKIREYGLTGKKRRFAIKLAERVIEKHDREIPAELAAEKAIEKAEEKLD